MVLCVVCACVVSVRCWYVLSRFFCFMCGGCLLFDVCCVARAFVRVCLLRCVCC